jgi:hypothetical protein
MCAFVVSASLLLLKKPRALDGLRVLCGVHREVLSEKELAMFLALAIIVLLVWGLGSFAFHVAGGLIHILLVIALVSVILHFMRGGGRGLRA